MVLEGINVCLLTGKADPGFHATARILPVLNFFIEDMRQIKLGDLSFKLAAELAVGSQKPHATRIIITLTVATSKTAGLLLRARKECRFQYTEKCYQTRQYTHGLANIDVRSTFLVTWTQHYTYQPNHTKYPPTHAQNCHSIDCSHPTYARRIALRPDTVQSIQ